MLVLFIVAFVVTLTAAVYMQFSSQADKHVLQYKLHPDAFAFAGVIMLMLALNGLRNSGLSNDVGITLLFTSWMPCALIAVRIEKLQENLCKLSVTPAGHNAKLAASFGMEEFGTDYCDLCDEEKHIRRFFHEQHGWILSQCVDSARCKDKR